MRTTAMIFVAGFVGLLGMTDPHRGQDYTIKGDGTLTDRGPGVAISRFVLDLGDIDLSVRGERVLRFAGLPREDFFVHLRLALQPEDKLLLETDDPDTAEALGLEARGSLAARTPGSTAVVQLSVKGRDGRTLVEYSGRLADWTWSGALGGDEVRLYDSSRDFLLECTTPDETYELAIAVVEPAPRQSSAKLLIEGGGWKAGPPTDCPPDTPSHPSAARGRG